MSTLKVPNQPPNVPPVALIELELLARFVPEEGFLCVQAQLSAQSYILSTSCHLQGGFAFYSWFSGEHGGDFVISIGGYHPKYKIPKHYPTVPRIGFNWQIDEHAHLKSLGYFALTSSAIMAGGGLDFTYQTSNLKA